MMTNRPTFLRHIAAFVIDNTNMDDEYFWITIVGAYPKKNSVILKNDNTVRSIVFESPPPGMSLRTHAEKHEAQEPAFALRAFQDENSFNLSSHDLENAFVCPEGTCTKTANINARFKAFQPMQLRFSEKTFPFGIWIPVELESSGRFTAGAMKITNWDDQSGIGSVVLSLLVPEEWNGISRANARKHPNMLLGEVCWTTAYNDEALREIEKWFVFHGYQPAGISFWRQSGIKQQAIEVGIVNDKVEITLGFHFKGMLEGNTWTSEVELESPITECWLSCPWSLYSLDSDHELADLTEKILAKSDEIMDDLSNHEWLQSVASPQSLMTAPWECCDQLLGLREGTSAVKFGNSFFSDFPSIRYRLGYGLAWLALNGGNEGLAREYMDIAISDATEPEDIDIFEELFSKQ